MAASLTARLRHHEDWRALSTINAFRCLLVFGLLGIQLSPVLQDMLVVSWPLLFDAISLAWLALAGSAIICQLLQRPALPTQVFLFVVGDIAALVGIMLASAGDNISLGFLVCVFVGCAGALLRLRDTIALAALAAAAVIAQQLAQPLAPAAAMGELLQAAALALLILFVAGLAQLMAQRVRNNQAMVAAHAGTLRNLTELNQRIIEQMEMGAVVLDGQHCIQLANAAAIRLLQAPTTPAPGATVTDLSPTLADALGNWLRNPGAPTPAIELNGRTLLPTFSILPIFSGRAAEANMPVLIFLEDAERQSEQAHNLKLAALGRLSAGIAHEIRNPLSAISHAAQLLAESEQLSTDDQKLLAIVNRHSHRIDAIVGDVMGLSRRGSGAQPPLLLKQCLQEVVVEYEQQSDQPATVAIEAIAPEQAVRFDPDHLHRIILNLCRNAERYARMPDRPLHIRLLGSRHDNGTYCLDVMDNGPGVDDMTINRILEPFYTTGNQGIGLGLHVARELCESNGARLQPLAHAEGACFRIVFSIPGGYSLQHG